MLFNKVDFVQRAIQPKLKHFDEFTLQLYNYQLDHNAVLQKFNNFTGSGLHARQLSDIRFLPVSFYKDQRVVTGNFTPETIYSSSTTGGGLPSLHYVASRAVYEQSYLEAFKLFYGEPSQYVFLCLLPSYLERTGSSLIDMAEGLIKASGNSLGGFYLYDFAMLNETIGAVQQQGKKVFLLGVTFALIDFAEQFAGSLKNDIVMETGGMKGRREEQTRAEIHAFLNSRFGTPHIHSEYGMTELLSQAYSKQDGVFFCPPWMRIVITDLNDPFTVMPHGKAGLINVIDLANVDSCAFIQTSDIGRILDNGGFEVLGRMDHSEVRGCNLMYS